MKKKKKEEVHSAIMYNCTAYWFLSAEEKIFLYISSSYLICCPNHTALFRFFPLLEAFSSLRGLFTPVIHE